MGFGQIYLGRIKEGLIFIGLELVCWVLFIISIAVSFFTIDDAVSTGLTELSGSVGVSILIGCLLMIIGGTGCLIVFVLAIVRCCNFAKENNTLWDKYMAEE